MAAASDYLENELLDHVLGNGAWTPPGTLYVALFTASPGDDNSGAANELTGGSYARQVVAFDVAAGGQALSSADITFTNLNGVSATPISHVGIYDADTAGNLLLHGPLNSAKTVPDGEDAVFRAGSIIATLS